MSLTALAHIHVEIHSALRANSPAVVPAQDFQRFIGEKVLTQHIAQVQHLAVVDVKHSLRDIGRDYPPARGRINCRKAFLLQGYDRLVRDAFEATPAFGLVLNSYGGIQQKTLMSAKQMYSPGGSAVITLTGYWIVQFESPGGARWFHQELRYIIEHLDCVIRKSSSKIIGF